MIIRYPTGFYRTVLPKDAEDPTSVTYTISSSEPPRTVLNFIQLPYSSRLGGLNWNRQEKKREAFGELALSASTAKQWNPVDGFKITNIGQILEFGVDTQPEPQQVFNTEHNVRHDVSYIDLARIGINDNIQESIRNAFNIAMSRLNALRSDQAKLITDTAALRTKVSDSIKAKAAVSAAGLADIAVKIQTTIDVYSAQIVTNNSMIADSARAITAVSNDINALSTLVQ